MPARKESDGRVLGVVYTPAPVARAMVRVALAPLLRDRAARDLLALRVCDPAVGEGVFVEAIIDEIAAALVAAWHGERTSCATTGHAPLEVAEARSLVARTCVFGLDIEPRAVAATRRLVDTVASAASAGGRDDERLHREAAQFLVGDALAIDWRAAFPDVDGFDLVVGNPPYIRQESLGAERKQALRSFACFDGVADLYLYFIELAHRIVRPGGRYCFVTPSKWLTAEYARPLRTFLVEQASVEGIVDLSRVQVFDDADAFACIVWGSRRDRASDNRGELRAVRLDVDRLDELPALDAIGDTQERSRFGAGPWHIEASRERDLFEQLARWPTLGEWLATHAMPGVEPRPARGIVTGLNKAFVVDRATALRWLDEDPAARDFVRPFVKGRDLQRWSSREAERYVLLVDRGTPFERLPACVATHLAAFRDELEPRPRDHVGAWPGRKPGAYRWFELQDPVGALAAMRAPRLFYQDIQTSPTCCLDERELVPDTTVWVLPTSDRFVLAVLNSRLYHWFARRRFPPALNGAVRPKLEYIRTLPIAEPTAAIRAAIEGLVGDQRARPREANSGTIDSELDALVFQAYGLDRRDRERISGP